MECKNPKLERWTLNHNDGAIVDGKEERETDMRADVWWWCTLWIPMPWYSKLQFERSKISFLKTNTTLKHFPFINDFCSFIPKQKHTYNTIFEMYFYKQNLNKWSLLFWLIYRIFFYRNEKSSFACFIFKKRVKKFLFISEVV